MKNTRAETAYLVRLAVLTGILFALEVLNLGMIRLFGLPWEITVMQIPVLIGAMLLGPAAGGILGGVFGLLSFWECFGKSAFGMMLLAVNPFYTFLTAFGTRVLMGLLAGLLFRALARVDPTRVVSFFAVGLAGALLNTALFVGVLMLLFGQSEPILQFRGTMALLPFMAAFVGVNGIVEAIACTVVCGGAGAALARFLPMRGRDGR